MGKTDTVFLVFGVVFTIVGATSNSGMLAAGLPFLLFGVVGLVYSRLKARGGANTG